MSTWIKTSDRLPRMHEDVLMFFSTERTMAVGFLCDVDENLTFWCAYTDDGFYTDCDSTPSHWQPLLPPPEEG